MDAQNDMNGSGDAEYERVTLSHWLGKVPDLDSITVIVRRRGRPAATVWIEPPNLPPDAASVVPRP